MMIAFVMAAYFFGGVALGCLVATYVNPCKELVAIERARDAKVAEQEQKMKDFWTNKGKPVERPTWGDPGLLGGKR